MSQPQNKPTLAFTFAPLPVSLISFDAIASNELTNLRWSTASETNNEGFQVQRSNDGTRWEDLGFVKGNDNSFSTINYSYTDESPNTGINYYRLKQMDFDGKFDYSKIRSVDIGGFDRPTIYPNPANTHFFIKHSNQSDPIHISIYNQFGALVLDRTTTDNTIDISELPNGVYNVQLSNTTTNSSTRLVKQ